MNENAICKSNLIISQKLTLKALKDSYPSIILNEIEANVNN